MRHLRFLVVISALLVAFGAVSATSGQTHAEDCDPPQDSDVACAIGGGTTGGGGSSGPTDDPWYVVVGTFYSYTSSDIKYTYAYTQRTEGSGPHELEVHGALVKDFPGEAETIYSFGPVIDHDGYVDGGTGDSWHDIDGVTWLIASGHYYDDGDNGSLDYECSGCNDYTH